MKTKFGFGQNEKFAIGAIVFRTRHKRNNDCRAFIKIASPSKWILLAHHIWQQKYGVIPPGFCVHHKDGDRLNDSIENLELVSKSTHLKIHRVEFASRALSNFIKARKRLRWSTISKNKRTGRHPKLCVCPIHRHA